MTDHIGLVDMRCQQQIVFRLEVDAIFINLNDFGFRLIKEAAYDLVFTLGRHNTNRNGIDKVAVITSLYFFYGNMSLLGKIRSVYEVDRILQDGV